MVGSELAGYQIEALIGRGGMGAVYRAEELALGRKVALKVIAPELARGQPLPRALPARVADRRLARPPAHRPDLQGGRRGRRSLPRDALRRGHRPREAPRGGRRARAPRARSTSSSRSRRRSTQPTRRASSTATSSPRTSSSPWPAGKEHCYLADFGLTKRTGSLSAASPPPATSSARSSTSRPSRSPATTSTRARTSTRSAASSTSA